MFKKIFTYTAFACLLMLSSAFASSGCKCDNIYDCSNSDSHEYVLYVPSGVTLTALLSQDLSSNAVVVGHSVSAIIPEDFKYKDKIIAPSGSVISGSVVSYKKGFPLGQNAQIRIRFTTIRTPYNNLIPISAIISTNDSSGILKSGECKVVRKKRGKTISVCQGVKLAANTPIEIKFVQPITLGAN